VVVDSSSICDIARTSYTVTILCAWISPPDYAPPDTQQQHDLQSAVEPPSIAKKNLGLASFDLIVPAFLLCGFWRIPYSQEIFHSPFDQKKCFLFLSSRREGLFCTNICWLFCCVNERRSAECCFAV
jgi:hypothetical protein